MWGADLRGGDRSVDVYVHKLRAKRETALPQYGFIHTHVGFGYRFWPEPAEPRPLHTLFTRRARIGNRL